MTLMTAHLLQVVTAPSSTAYPNQALPTQPAVSIVDHAGKVVDIGDDASLLVTVSLLGNGTLNGTTSVHAVDGVATFSDLVIVGKGAPGSKRLRFVFGQAGMCGCLEGHEIQSSVFDILPARAAVLVVTTQPPAGVVEGGQFAWSLSIRVEDTYNEQILDGPDSMLAVSIGVVHSSVSASITHGGTQDGVEGIVVFANVSVGGGYGVVGVGHKLEFSGTGLGGDVSVRSNYFRITPQAASLHVALVPSTTVESVVFGVQPVVHILHSGGGIVDVGGDSELVVEVALDASLGALLGANRSVRASGGVVQYQGLAVNSSLSEGMGKQLVFSAVGTGGALSTASGVFNVTAAATSLMLTVQPSEMTIETAPFSRQPKVAIYDLRGNLVTVGLDSSLTVSASVPTGSLQGNVAQVAQSGTVSYGGLGISGVGSDKVLRFAAVATSGGVVSTSTSPEVSITPIGTALGMSQQVSSSVVANEQFAQQPVVRVLDKAAATVTEAQML